MSVTLNRFEMQLAAQIGALRQIEALDRGRRDNHGFVGDGWGAHIEGAAAEMAVSKLIDRCWLPVVEDPHALDGDVGRRRQVRSTAHETGCLIVHPSDLSDDAFVLVVGRMPTFRVAGWVWGREAKKDEFWREGTGRPAFFVPQRVLRPMRTRTEVPRAAA